MSRLRKEELKGNKDCIHNRGRACNILRELYCAKEDKPCKFFDTSKSWDEKQKKYGKGK